MRFAIVAVSAAIAVMAAVGWSSSFLTETGGGTPAPPRPPDPAVKIFDPKTTSVFTDQQTFFDSATCRSLSLESFEEITATNQRDTSSLILTDFAITTNHPPQLGIWAGRYEGSFATDGHQWMGIEEHQLVVPHVTTMAFDVPINHFGINITSYGNFAPGNLEFANEIGDQATAAFSGQPSGNWQFFGIINTSRSFRTVTLTHSAAGEFYGVDEITYCWHGAPDTPISRQSSGRVTPD